MARAVLTLEGVDLADNDNFVDDVPWAMFDLLRREAPVYWHPEKRGSGFWAVTKHADLVAVHRDTKTFSSEIGATALEELSPEQIEARKSMLDMDPPRHTRLRSIVNRQFTPRAVAAYELLLRELSREILDRALSRGEFDYLTDVAAVLPIRVLAEILGVPPADHDRLVEWGDRMIGNTDPEYTDVLLDSEESEKYKMLPFRSPAAVELFEYGHRLAAERREDPRDDIVTRLALAEIDGERLTEREFDTMFLLLVVAGNETTRQAIAHGTHALIEHPDQLARLREDFSLLPTATEEILRWSSPVMHFRRTATVDTDLRGQRIRAGDKVVTWYISANRDEDVFDDPYAFDIERHPNDHVTFGKGGPHFCLGAHLARLEIRVLFEELLPRIRTIELAGPVARLRSNFTNGIKHMPVRVEPA